MKKLGILLFLLASTSFLLVAQNLVIEGVVKARLENETLPYANVFLQKSQIGTITNEKGVFRLVIPKANAEDSLVISYIGYQTRTLALNTVSSKSNILLDETEITLSGVMITGISARTIMEKAIARIPENYDQNPFQTRGFYRLTSKKGESYVHLSEAVFDTYQSKSSKPNQQFRLEKMRAIRDEKASEGLNLGMRPEGIYSFDIVNHPKETELLEKKGLKIHTFKNEGTQLIDGRPAYKITFDQKDIKNPGYRGSILIDVETYAFVYFDFGISPEADDKRKYGSPATRAVLKIMGIDLTLEKNNYQIFYKRFGDKYYLNNVGNDAILHFASERDHYNFSANSRVDFLVTELRCENVQPFTNDEIIGQGKMIESQKSFYDPNFWDAYTILLASNDFSEIAAAIAAKNKANSTKLEIQAKLDRFPKVKSIRIDSILQFYNDRDLFNGNALIAFENEVLLQKSYNNAHTKNKQESQFRIGSLSKTFTAMVMLKLENEGKLSFNDTIGKFLPHFPNGQVTIAQLLSHQSGITNYLDKDAYLAQILNHEFSLAGLVTNFCSDPLEFEPGTQFTYSNSNFVILALIAERVAGKKFDALLQQYIFSPVEMPSSYVGLPKDAKNLVTAYIGSQPEPKYNPQNVIGAGGITSTAADLFKWSQALDGDRLLLPRSEIAKLWKPQVPYLDWDAFYGYGWLIDTYMFSASKDHQVIYHPGVDFGFHTMFVKQPDLGITIILLNNTGDFPRFEMTELILNVLK